MPPSSVQNPSAKAESSKKKKAKAARTESPAPSASPAPEKSASVSGADAGDDESPYTQELKKNIRNINKKIINASKTDPIIDQNKDKTLEELVASKLINPDQRAQRLKKPQLEAELAQNEKQLAQFKKVDDDYRARSAAAQATLESTLGDTHAKDKAEAIAALTEKAASDAKQSLHDGLLVLSHFLRLAAARRSEDADAGLDENMALEGVLLNVYSGDENAVATMLKLIEGSDETTRNISGEPLQTTFAQVKAAAVAYISPFAATETAPEASEAAVESSAPVESDPTIIHAGLTEIDTTGATAPMTNGHESSPQSAYPTNAGVADGAANAAAEHDWDTNNNMSASINQEDWVQVPRDPTETETGVTATPAASSNVQSWADEQPDPVPQAPAATEANDGFHQVHRNRPRGHEREGSFRGRGRGDYRGGRGGFHEGRGGRGRGRGRGMGMRGGRPRAEES